MYQPWIMAIRTGTSKCLYAEQDNKISSITAISCPQPSASSKGRWKRRSLCLTWSFCSLCFGALFNTQPLKLLQEGLERGAAPTGNVYEPRLELAPFFGQYSGMRLHLDCEEAAK